MKSAKNISFFLNEIPRRFFLRFSFVQVLLLGTVLTLSTLTTRALFKQYFINQKSKQQIELLTILSREINRKDGIDSVCNLYEDNKVTRLTVMDFQGRVLCDNWKKDILENHLMRPEVQLAFNKGLGESVRLSDTVGQVLVYNAMKTNRFVVRISSSFMEIEREFSYIDKVIIFSNCILIIIVFIFAFWGSWQLNNSYRQIIDKIRNIKGVKISDDLVVSHAENDLKVIDTFLNETQLELENKISELTHEHEKLEVLLNSINDPIVALDMEEKLLFMNPKFAKGLGEGISSNSSPLKVLNNEDLIQMYNECVHTGLPTQKKTISLKNKNKDRFYDVVFSPLKENNGALWGAICILRDITVKKLADQMREEFVSNVSHELRTPLTALKGYVQLMEGQLQEMGLSDQLKEYTEKIHLNSERLIVLFNDILNLSSIESRKKIGWTEINLDEVIDLSFANVQMSFPETKVNLELKLDQKTVTGDGALLEQVFSNLFSNSFKYAGIETTISVSSYLKNDDIFIEVTDTGPGVKEEYLGRIFERFYRVDSSRSRDSGGTGLGLAIVKHIIFKHNGSIRAENILPHGLKFIIKLPL